MTKTWEDIEEEVILYDIIVQIQEKKTQNAAINNITKVLKEKIIQALSKTEGKRVTDISNETGIDEKTVHHCLKYNLMRQCYVEKGLWFIRQAPKQPKNQRWDVEESVALFSLYFKYGSSNKVPKEEVEKLSQVFNKRADRLGVKKTTTYRNTIGLSMQLECIRYVVTNGAAGLSQASKLFYDTYEMYKNNKKLFDVILKIFNDVYVE